MRVQRVGHDSATNLKIPLETLEITFFLIMLSYLNVATNVCEIAQSCPTLCNPIDYRLPGSSFHGIFQARILERAAISFSGGSSRPSDRTLVSCTAGRLFLPSEPLGKCCN